MTVPNRALLRLARDLADSGFRGVVRAYYVRRDVSTITIEFIIYKRPSIGRRVLARVREALELASSIMAAVIVGFILALIIKWVV